MTPDPTATGDAPNRRRDLVTKFLDEYSDALAAARISAEHTATEGWRRLYYGHYEDLRLARRQAALGLRELAERLEDAGLDDEQAKDIGDAKKIVNLINERQRHFYDRTIDPVIKPVHDCAKVIEKYLAAARREEAEAPLALAGLEDVMKDAVSKQPRALFDDETGVVAVVEP